VVVTHNTSRGAGGGIHFYHADGSVTNALIADNSGRTKGGGMHFDGCSPAFVNVTVVGNWTAGQGGGLNVSYMSQPTLVNSIVWGNSPQQIYFDTDWPGEAVTIEHSDIQGGAAGIATNGQGPVYWGGGNVDVSPGFVDVGLGNYHLADDSPCICAGRAAGAPITDIEGNARPSPAGSNPDMGAYENLLGLPLATAPASVAISGPVAGVTRAAHTFTAVVDPPTATTPMVYTWTPVPKDGQGTAVATYTWLTVGSKLVAVTAENVAGTVTGIHVIAIQEPHPIWLPLVLR
jgi:hypothetical protein